MYAYRVKMYFRRLSHKIDFISNALFRTSEIAIVVKLYIRYGMNCDLVDKGQFVLCALKLCCLLRLNRILAATQV